MKKIIMLFILICSFIICVSCGGKKNHEHEYIDGVCSCGAVYETSKHTIKFDTGGGTIIPDQIIEDEGYINMPENPKKDGYVFIGWLRNGEMFVPGTVIRSSFTLVAFWEKEEEIGITEGLQFRDMISHYEFAGVGTSQSIIINIPSTYNGKEVKGIGPDSFDEIFYVEKIILPDTIEYIKEEGFSGLELLKEINLPDGLLTIGESAFEECQSLKEISIPDSVTEIKSYAFDNCISLEKIDISVTSKLNKLEDYAFSGCESLKKIYIPDNANQIGDYLFEDCFSLEEISVGPKNIGYSSYNGVLYNKEGTNLIRYPQNKPDKEFIVPSTVTKIKAYSFDGVRKLEKLVINDNVKEIEYSVIPDTECIKEVYIGDGVEVIKPYAFSCSNFYEIIFYCEHKSKPEEWALYWGNDKSSVVWDCLNENEVALIYRSHPGTFVKTVKVKISDIPTEPTAPTNYGYRFDGWLLNGEKYNFDTPIKEQTILVANWVEDIGTTMSKGIELELVKNMDGSYYMVTGAGSFEDSVLNIPGEYKGLKVKGIKDSAFYNIDFIERVILGEGITYIGDYAFSECDRLDEIFIPNTIEYIGNNAIKLDDDRLIPYNEGYYLGSLDNPFLVYYASCNDEVENIEISSRTKLIMNGAFKTCNNLKSINVSNVEIIMQGAFNNIPDVKIYTTHSKRPSGWYNFSNEVIYNYHEHIFNHNECKCGLELIDETSFRYKTSLDSYNGNKNLSFNIKELDLLLTSGASGFIELVITNNTDTNMYLEFTVVESLEGFSFSLDEDFNNSTNLSFLDLNGEVNASDTKVIKIYYKIDSNLHIDLDTFFNMDVSICFTYHNV